MVAKYFSKDIECDHDEGRALEKKSQPLSYYAWFCPICECWLGSTFIDRDRVKPSFKIDPRLRRPTPCDCKDPMEDSGFNPGFCMLCGGRITSSNASNVLKICSHLRKYGHRTITSQGFLAFFDLGNPHCTRCNRDLCTCGAGWKDSELWEADKCFHCGKAIDPHWGWVLRNRCSHLLPDGKDAIERPSFFSLFSRERCKRCGKEGCKVCGSLKCDEDCWYE
ncbi:MAG: hypothetical protein BMS9Abin34_459 [Patescibacteria group bacterium]|nr:MAG: hypothetical protein BMS9Abin34_459 [Patescibacteria group bacterium]